MPDKDIFNFYLYTKHYEFQATFPYYKDKIEEAFLDIPTISLITDSENLFDPQKGKTMM
jgi:hypothetical protein